ncbi:MAG: DUF1801 domain-containing protein [Arenibacter sp.]|nr:DUF1801 domain-containing protein [Arenibacter sp.]
MAENKTKPTSNSVSTFLNACEPEQKRLEAWELVGLFQKITGEPPVLWGESIVGFGKYHYKYKTGREGDMLLTGFSPRKQNFSIYIMAGFPKYQDLLEKLGPHKTGKSCLYIKRLSDIDLNVLGELIKTSFETFKDKKWP